MNGKRVFTVLMTVVIALGLAFSVMADDSVMFRRNISKTPDGETEKAGISMMFFYVPAQSADGTLLTEGVEYWVGIEDENGEVIGEELAVTRSFVKPLTAVFIDEEYLEEVKTESLGDSSIMTGIAFGTFDAFGALSLDDGTSWKTYNLSRSADLSSFTLANGHEYPGAVHVAMQTTADNRIMIAWISRYCDGGNPNYINSIDKNADGLIDDSTEYLYYKDTYGLPDLYLRDVFGVQGTQQSVDYTLQGYPEVGEIPYGCVWAARGQLVEKLAEDGVSVYRDILWTKPERLTSGKRDPNKLEIDSRAGGGFIISWQEDPEGLRPGKGLGPGEGWSGAIVNSRTDIWYSYVSWNDFGLLNIAEADEDPETIDHDVVTMEEYAAGAKEDGTTIDASTMPKVEVPMAMPIRLTDNNSCRDTKSDPYCYVDFEDYQTTALPDALPLELADATTTGAVPSFCFETVPWTNPGGTTLNICKAEDGRYLRGRVGSSRPRIGLYPLQTSLDDPSTPDVVDPTYRYFVVMAYEETKALGDGVIEDKLDPIDIGKNVWYHSFDMFNPDMIAQGGMLNQPAIAYRDDPLTEETEVPGEFFPMRVDEFTTYEFFETEIARRFSLVAQPVSNIGPSRTTAFLIYKQGIINQGGPADVFARRVVLPPTCDEFTTENCFDPAVNNPYAFEYIDCPDDGDETTRDGWETLYNDESLEVVNPNYLQGVCMSPAVNFSGTSIVACDFTEGDCAADFPWDGLVEEEKWIKVTEWSQSGPDYGADLSTITTDLTNLDDQSWENPYDVSKGHRGFLDGDFLMVMYAYAPNWKANSVGNDHFNLYVRRSFDGGQTFTNLPEGFDENLTAYSINTCENYGQGSNVYQVCTDYAPGAFEQGRNVSQLTGNKVTVLDPRYTPTGGLKMSLPKDIFAFGSDPISQETLPYPDDYARDRSKFFVIFETGDNTTMDTIGATPMDLFFSRASDYGNTYDDVIYVNKGTDTDPDWHLVWDWVENQHDDLSGEAGMLANPAGTFMYTVWNQWQEFETDVITESDIIFRRFFYNTVSEMDPVAEVLSDIPTILVYGETMDLFGTGWDLDSIGEGIVEYEWVIEEVEDEDEEEKEGVYETHKHSHLYMKAEDYEAGVTYKISFRVKDNEGTWSTAITFEIMIWEEFHQINIPMVHR